MNFLPLLNIYKNKFGIFYKLSTVYPCTPKLLLLEPGYEATAMHACLPSARARQSCASGSKYSDSLFDSDFKVSTKVSGYKRTWIQYSFSLVTCEREA